MGFKEGETSGRKWNRLIDNVIMILKYKKCTIDHAIYIKVFFDVTVSYLIVFTDDVVNTTNNNTAFPELTRVFKEYSEMKVQEEYVLT